MVALVVTIVVLLILSTITIQGITHTGLFSSAENAKLDYKRGLIANTLETKLKISQSEQIRGTDEQIIKATYEDVKNDLEEIKKAGGKNIEVGEVTSDEKDGRTEWFFEVKVDGDVYKVALDGSDFLGKEDELAPLIQIKTTKATTNTITVNVTTKRNEGGKVEYYIKEKAASKFTLAKTTDQNEYTYTGLKQDTTFVIKAIAIGKNGKEKESKEVEIETSTVPKIDSKEIEFAVEPNTWTNQSVKVTAKPKVDTQGFTLVTSKNPTSSWTKVNNQTFSTNGTMYVALTDGNNYGVTASHEVTNIDKIKPKITSVTATTNTIKITATDEASGISAYAISESSTMPTKFTVVDSTKIFNKIIENKKQSTKYYVWVKDQAGNVSEVASTTTGTVAGLTDANTTFSKTPNDWTNKDVTVTASTTERNFALQTKKDNGEWQTTGTQTFTENGTIYARLWDGINAGAETKLNVTNIDKLAPNAFTPKTTVTTNSIKVDGTTTDATATSTNGSSGIKEYRFSKDGGKTYTNAQTSATYTFSGLTQNVEYTIVVEAKDNAGNTTNGTVKVTTGTVPTASGAAYTPTTWTKGNVTVTLPTKSGYTTVYTTNGTAPTKDSTKYSAAFTVSSNCKINYLYTDGTNIGGAGTVNVTNIDKLAPNAFTPKTTVTTNSIKVDGTTTDATATSTNGSSGIKEYRFSKDGGKTYTNAQTSATYTFSGLTQNVEYTIVVEAKDNAGNTTTGTVKATTGTVPTASGATYTPTTWTKGNVTVTLPTKSGYSTVYTTNGTAPTKDSTKYSAAFTVSNNCTIYYLFTDGINIGGAGTVNIGNIDKTAPTINSVTENSNTSTASTATISTSDNGRIVSYGISTSSTTQPTNWIATNKVDLTNVPVKVENGATWARVFYHNNVEGSVLFANEAEALSTNSRYKFSVLNNLENYRNSSGTFEFMLQYPNDTTQYNRWIQKDNPAKVTVANGTGNETASGYKAVHVDWTGNYWGGLTRSTATSACLINGSVGHGNWFYAIGAYSRYDKGIPSYSATATATELWARIDNLTTEGKTSLNATLGNITTNGTYYAWVKDAAENVTSKQFTISKVDKTAPTISNLTSSNTNWTSGNVTLTATASDAESGLYTASPYGWNSTTTWTNSNTLNVTKNGTYTVNVRNAIGNISSKSIVVSNIDKTGPTINTALTGSGTTNSITLNTAVSDTQSGVNKIIWYYKLSTDSTYKNATDTYTSTTTQTTRTHTFTGLIQNKTYNVYAEIYDAVGNKTIATTINVTTGTVPTASGATYTPNTWTSGNVTVTLPTKNGYTTVYTTNGTAPTKDSTKYSAAFTVSSNCKINYLYTDGTNIGGAGTVNVTNIDKTAPTFVSGEVKNLTTTGYDVYVYGITDTQSGVNRVQFPTWTNANGQDDIQSNWWDPSNTVAKGTKQADGTTWVYHVNIKDHKNEVGLYYTHVYVYDNLGNSRCVFTPQITVPKVPDITSANASFSYNPKTWTSGSVRATASTTVSGYYLQTSTDAQTWKTQNYVDRTTNGAVYARLTDGVNVGNYVTGNVGNIDKTAPTTPTLTAKIGSDTGSTYTSGVWTNQAVIITATSSDTQSQINRIEYSYDNSTWNTNWGTSLTTSGNNKSIKGTWGTNYNTTVYVRAVDNAGNVSGIASIVVRHDTTVPVTPTITAKVGSDTGSAYTSGSWTSQPIIITATSSDTQSQINRIEYSYNNSSWSTSWGTDLTTNGNSKSIKGTWNGNYNNTVYVRAVDNVGNVSASSSIVIREDATAPTINTGISGTATSKSIILSLVASDNLSGVNRIVWYYKDSTASSYTSATDTYTATMAQTTRTHTFTNLTHNRTYNAYAVVYDAVGRTTQSTTINVNTGTVPTASGATYTPSTWTNGNVSVTLPTKSGYSTLYTTNGTIPTLSSNQYTSAITVGSNSTIYYVFSDGINIGGTGAVNINNIDKIKPEINISNNETSSSAILEIKAADNVGVKSIVTSGGKNTITNAQNISSKELEYNLELTDDGETKITVTDIAGNTVEKNYKLKFLFKQNDERTAVTGGWKENMFLNIYGYIYNVGYTKNNGLLTITAEPTSVDQGRLGTWYTNNSIDFTGYDTIRSATWFNKNSTGSVELRVGYNSVAQDNINTIKKVDANGGYWSKLTANILGKDKSQVAIGTNGGKSDFVQIYLACMYIFSLK